MQIDLSALPNVIAEQLKTLSPFLKSSSESNGDIILCYEFRADQLDISTISYDSMKVFFSSCSIEYVRTKFITNVIGTVIGGGELVGYKITLIMPKTQAIQ